MKHLKQILIVVVATLILSAGFAYAEKALAPNQLAPNPVAGYVLSAKTATSTAWISTSTLATYLSGSLWELVGGIFEPIIKSVTKLGLNGQQMMYLPDQTQFSGTTIYGNGGGSLYHNPTHINPLSGLADDGWNNLFVGYNAGLVNTQGNYNTFLGSYAGYNNTTGDQNTFLGVRAGRDNTTGSYNLYITGGKHQIDGNFNVCAGTDSCLGQEHGDDNTYLGAESGALALDTDDNTIVGSSGNARNLTGSNITGVGSYVFDHNLVGPNTAVGTQAMYWNASGTDNVALGYKSLFENTTGNWNMAIGDLALSANTTGFNNVVVGSGMTSNHTGYNNTSIGFSALNGVLGHGNVGIGAFAGKHAVYTDELYIDDRDRGTNALEKTMALIYGNFASATSSQQLTINGTLNVAVDSNIAGTQTVGNTITNVATGYYDFGGGVYLPYINYTSPDVGFGANIGLLRDSLFINNRNTTNSVKLVLQNTNSTGNPIILTSTSSDDILSFQGATGYDFDNNLTVKNGYGITLGGVYRDSWPGGSGGTTGLFWATSSDSLVVYPNLSGDYAVKIGGSATTSDVKFEVAGNTKLGGNTEILATDNYGGLRLVRSESNSVIQRTGIVSKSYNSAEPDVTNMLVYGGATTNQMFIGGGVSAFNPVSSISLYTSPTATTTTIGLKRMIIDANGNVGIGTSTPAAKLQVEDGDIYISSSTRGVLQKSIDDPNVCVRLAFTSDMNFVPSTTTCP